MFELNVSRRKFKLSAASFSPRLICESKNHLCTSDRDWETDEVSIAGKLRYKQIVNEDGTKICSGELPKWKSVSTYDIPLCSFHHRGGLGSSNIRFWGFRPFVWEQSKLRGIDLKGTRRGAFNEDQEALFKELRKTYFNSCRELFNVFREMLLDPSIIFNQRTLNEQQDLL